MVAPTKGVATDLVTIVADFVFSTERLLPHVFLDATDRLHPELGLRCTVRLVPHLPKESADMDLDTEEYNIYNVVPHTQDPQSANPDLVPHHTPVPPVAPPPLCLSTVAVQVEHWREAQGVKDVKAGIQPHVVIMTGLLTLVPLLQCGALHAHPSTKNCPVHPPRPPDLTKYQTSPVLAPLAAPELRSRLCWLGCRGRPWCCL